MKTRWLIAPLMLLVAVGSGLSLRARQDVPAQIKPTIVPFKMLPSNHMVVEAKLNGKGPYRFIFDLGAPVTLLSNRAADAAGAIGKGVPKSFMMGARGEGKVDMLEMGELKAKGVPVLVMDHPAVKALSGFLDKPIEGIIGYTFWARYRMSIDYKSLKMTFTPVPFEVRDLMKDLPAKLSGPKVAKRIMLSPRGLWGLTISEPSGGLASAGVPITTVWPGSPAEAAGLKAGDILTSLDGRWTTSVSDAYSAASKAGERHAVAVIVLRDGKELTLSVTPSDGI